MERSLCAARDALAAGRWIDARTLYENALQDAESAEACEGLSQALWWLDDVAEAVRMRERAYVLARAAGDAATAIRNATWISRLLASFGNAAASDGWLARAESLAEEAGPTIERAYVELMRAKKAADAETAECHAARALGIARDFGDIDFEMFARSELGRALVTRGRIDEGMRQLDEAVAAATGGEMRQLPFIGDTCCNMLSACERAADYVRLWEWFRIVDDFCRRHHCTPMMNYCRTLFGGALITVGRWCEAEQELLAAAAVSDENYPSMRVAALARLALLRVREGRFDEARSLLTGIENQRSAAEAVAALELATGNAPTAAVVLRRSLRDTAEDALTAVPLLDLFVIAMLALGDAEQARVAASRLAAVAERTNRTPFRAFAVRAAARVDLDCAAMERAAELFDQASMRFDAAVCRLELAEQMAESDRDTAAFDARIAFDAFDRLGANAHADRAAQLLRSLGVRGRPTPRSAESLTRRERQVFDLMRAGLSNAEIGERLFISPKTVEHHVSSILGKLGARNRVEAAALPAFGAK
jgi:DNA-binding NarL/FixJ family response regulator